MNNVARLLVLAVAFAGAPGDEAAAQTIGFKLGMTSSTIKSRPEDPQEPKPDRLSSFGGGGFVRFGAAGLQLQAEVLALTKGARSSDSDGDVKLKLGYVEIPLTAMFMLGRLPYVFGGPAVAFETGCDFEASFLGGSFKGSCDDPQFAGELKRKKMDLGAVIGAGVQIPLGPGHALLEARHTWGLTNLNDDNTSNESTKNRSIAVFAGFGIPIGGRMGGARMN